MHYLNLLPQADLKKIQALLQEKAQWLALGKKGVDRFRLSHESVQHIRAKRYDFSGDVVKIGGADELSDQDRKKVYKAMRDYMP